MAAPNSVDNFIDRRFSHAIAIHHAWAEILQI